MGNGHGPGRWLIASVILAIGMAAAGWLSARGLAKFRTADRYVTVKGLAERHVDADLVVWPLPHAVMGNNLAAVQSQLDANTTAIRRFFTETGFTAEEVVISPPRLEDRAAPLWQRGGCLVFPLPLALWFSSHVLIHGGVLDSLEALLGLGALRIAFPPAPRRDWDCPASPDTWCVAGCLTLPTNHSASTRF